ncbi:hypothetical protein COCSUDRAFT_55570 [Coccomyxa subellipsoidea C-169]|uniref:Uncharacterized protein n=1 Tax=Coccomyxa subellipsoidea (strain C-169) TaxID=574566 RepID=I0ZAA3_COCSC|nr:hypothetical protein COCSUDRAFT_55570 [Coccomyxa subellipsoidea C-169]EIE27572.1 hypothetical protein COCSUDRAFT_55570 [Coccomyxa subellipsoidea C-169]|eukprot:XP_005652116.1 hypothetical protein COCSUDRAFT_55570 [Coccomyxa subellipsoidea C-169]
MTDKVGTEADKLPATGQAGDQKVENKGDDLLDVKADQALHGGTNIVPETHSAAVPVEKISTPVPGVQPASGTSR